MTNRRPPYVLRQSRAFVASIALAMVGSASVASAELRGTDLPSGLLRKLAGGNDTVAVLPVEGGRIGSGFGMRHSRRDRSRRQFHAGMDVPAPIGTSVLAARDGVVRHVVRDDEHVRGFDGYGNAIVVYHPDDGHYSLYAHLSEVGVAVGDLVLAGEKIGRVGATTNGKFPGMGPHLHMEVRTADRDGDSPFPSPYGAYNIDPQAWLVGHGWDSDRTMEPRVARPAGRALAK